MAPDELPLRCLAVRVVPDANGEIDRSELQVLLNHLAGEDQWITADQWLFIDPPLEAAGEVTLPVVMPVDAAIRAVLNDLTNEPPRIITDYQTTPAETRRWRWLASQIQAYAGGKSHFPWESAIA